MTGNLRHRYGMQADKYCKLCVNKTVSTPKHTLGGCKHSQMRGMHIKRHNEAVHILRRAIKRGHRGIHEIRVDAGTDTTDGTRSKSTIPKWAMSEKDFEGAVKPDMVIMIGSSKWCNFGIRNKGDYETKGYMEEHYKWHWRERERRKMVIIEVTYTYEDNIQRARESKQEKYKELVRKLRNRGWTVTKHTIVLGNMGGIEEDMKKVLKVVGLRGEGATRVIKELHDNAVKWLVKLVDTEKKLNGWGGEGSERARSNRREADEGGRLRVNSNGPRPSRGRELLA